MSFLQQLTYIFIALILLLTSCKEASKPSIKTEKASLNSTKQVARSPLYQSYDNGKSWQATGMGIPAGTQASFLEKIDNQLIMASDNAGLFISDVAKVNWSSIGKNLPNKKINALHISGTEIYAGVYREGIYFSSDKGKNWLPLNFDLPDLRVNAILNNQSGLLVGTDYGVFQLKKGQTNWGLMSDQIQITSFDTQKEKIIAGTNKGVLLSNDNGMNWEWTHQNGAIHSVALLDQTIVAMYISGDLYISKDWGQNWAEGNYGPKYASYGYTAATQTTNSYILSNNYGVHQSIDGGFNWELIYPDEDKILIDFLVDDNVIYAGTRAWGERRGR